jgi:multiple sugar transport system permease protein
MFLMRQFMLGIPLNFDEAARIDGASEFAIYSRVIMPMLKPVITVVLLFSFTGQWNDLLWPSIVFNDVHRMPLTPGLQLLMGAFGNFFMASIITAAVVALVPTFLLYLFAQKYFLQSLSLSSGVKG